MKTELEDIEEELEGQLAVLVSINEKIEKLQTFFGIILVMLTAVVVAVFFKLGVTVWIIERLPDKLSMYLHGGLYVLGIVAYFYVVSRLKRRKG